MLNSIHKGSEQIAKNHLGLAAEVGMAVVAIAAAGLYDYHRGAQESRALPRDPVVHPHMPVKYSFFIR